MHKTTLRSRTVSLLGAVVVALLVSACGGGGDDGGSPPASSDPRTPLLVTKADDDGSEGTLRWAILQSNASPGTYRIVLSAPAGMS